jgi:hypothetical protein
MHLRQRAAPMRPASDCRPRSARQRSLVAALMAAAAGWALAAAACSSTAPSHRSHDHGLVVAHLSIPFRPAAGAGGRELITVTVSAGQRFSVKVDTSDGPYWWSQSGTPPDPRIVRLIGDFNQGSCAPGLVGCRVPYFHTLLARSSGMTTMTWTYHQPPCQAAAKAPSPASTACPKVTVVIFDISVR